LAQAPGAGGRTVPNTKDQVPTILIADDNEANRVLLAEILDGEHYRIVHADDGDEALRLAEEGEIDLVLSDVMMPRRSGFAVCRALKSNPDTRLIPVVLVTSLSASEDRMQGIESGADDFLNKPVNKEELLARVRSLLKIKQFTDELEHAENVLFALALSIEAKDPYTEGHCDRLSESSEALAKRLTLSEEARIALRRGGVIHDIGKVAVPDQILLKPGPLTPEERKVMQHHTVVGAGICSPLKSFRSVLPIIRHHHEKMDGSGYPDGLKGDAIPLTARILQTVDIYDALTTDRPYRKALTPERAFALMREEVKKGWWDSALVDELEAMVQTSVLSN
jgi:putative two-component system response regulator